jgi:hypothetical protein
MKKIFIALLFLFNCSLVNAVTSCNCGSFETGTYSYFVLDDGENDGDCCTGKDAGLPNFFFTYRPGSTPGTWVTASSDRISFGDAVNACCPIS